MKICQIQYGNRVNFIVAINANLQDANHKLDGFERG